MRLVVHCVKLPSVFMGYDLSLPEYDGLREDLEEFLADRYGPTLYWDCYNLADLPMELLRKQVCDNDPEVEFNDILSQPFNRVRRQSVLQWLAKQNEEVREPRLSVAHQRV